MKVGYVAAVLVVALQMSACFGVVDACACSRPADHPHDDIRQHPEGPAQERPEMHDIR
jgi:hypothetical protein